MLEKDILPCDIKNCSIEELENVAAEIRGKIIDVCAKKGGHLASSLGMVEVCLALNYTLNLPEDLIVYDVGHQSYAHKIITGRASAFSKIREYQGISGFPNIKESEYDAFTAGHASNSVSLALGAVCANKIVGKKSKVVAVVGDGSFTGGECFEGMNHAGHLGEDITVVFNHNEMSISPSIGAIGKYLSDVQSSPVYARIKRGIDKFFLKHPKMSKVLLPRLKKFEEVLKGLFVPGIFFEELGFRYFGPFDGHDLDLLTKNFSKIIALDGPKLIHVVTKKGKGFIPAEKNAEKFHSAGSFSKEDGEMKKKTDISYTDFFGEVLAEEAKENTKICALTAAMETGTGISLFKNLFPERFFDVAIAEQHLISFTGGLCKQGLKPFTAVYSTFLQRGYDQLMQDITLQGFNPVICIDRAGLVGEDGPTHHGVFDIAYMRSIPDFIVSAPAYKEDLKEMIKVAQKAPKAMSIRYPKATAYERPLREKAQIGKFETIQKGKKVAVLALGSMFEIADRTVEKLNKEGKTVSLINPRFVKPLDEETLLALAKEVDTVITMEEGTQNGGFGEAVLSFYNKQEKKPKIEIMAIKDEYVTFGKRDILLSLCGLDEESLYKKIIEKI